MPLLKGGWKFLVNEIIFSQKHLPGVLKRKKKRKKKKNVYVLFPY